MNPTIRLTDAYFVFTLFIIVMAAAEAAVALAIILSIYRNFRNIDAEKIDEMKG